MSFRGWLLCLTAAVCPLSASCSQELPIEDVSPIADVSRYSGMCDASAAVALDAATLIAADDEQNTLKVYRADRPGPPVQSIPWDEPLGIDPAQDKHPEVDIEGATVLGGRIYWISSHGRNKGGKWRANRHRLFAMTVTVRDGKVVAEPFGKASRTLIADLVRDDRMKGLGLAEALAIGKTEVGRLAPKKKGLNIEGLCATPDGKSLLIGFRNPCGDGKALLVPLHNPAAVLADGAAPRFGQPFLLNLQTRYEGESHALSVRSMEYSAGYGAYLIVAGRHDERKVFALFRWSGGATDPPILLRDGTASIQQIPDFTPEALIVYPDRDEVQLLSDDGTLKVKVASAAECAEGEFDAGQCEAKYLRDETRKTFRSLWIKPDALGSGAEQPR
ncbi:MAG: hypothetical protein JXB62_02335 [Pirellulales bacterium]|nr:hypothetical protein [Pirellulales bacterium]